MPLRVDVSGQLTIRSLAERIESTAAADAARADVPLHEIARAAQASSPAASVPPTGPVPHPLCQAAFFLAKDDLDQGAQLSAHRHAPDSG